MIISINAKKNPTYLHDKNPREFLFLYMFPEGTYSKLIKSIYEKLTANIINRGKPETISL